MKKIVIAALILVFVSGYLVIHSIAEEKAAQNGGMSDAAKLIGMKVRNSQGEDLVIIGDVVQGPQKHISFAVLNYAMSDDTQMRIAVPFEAFSCGEQSCTLDVSRRTLNSAPVFAWDGDLSTPKEAEGMYRYFGIQPYWTEKGAQE